MRLIASDILNRSIDLNQKNSNSDQPIKCSAWVRGDCEDTQELPHIATITLAVCISTMRHNHVSQ